MYGGDAAAKQNSVFRHKVLEVAPGQYQEFALSHPGDARRGSKLFHDIKGLGCIRCHHMSGEGGDIGPDLTDVRAKHDRAYLIESVLFPSKEILDGYQQVFFETKDDEEISGIVRAETPAEITIIDSGGIKHELEKSKITSRRISKISLMPEGLQDGLSLVEFSDLIAYLENPTIPALPTHAAPVTTHPRPVHIPNPIITASQDVPPPAELTAEELFSPFSPAALTAPPMPATPQRSEPPPSQSLPAPSPPPPSFPSSSTNGEAPGRLVAPPSGPTFPPAPPVPDQ
jgi:putative heme-binding domain-containing protein